MSIDFVKGGPADQENIVDFANYVFSHSGSKTDFPSLLPKFYQSGRDTSALHYLAKQDGKILALLLAAPYTVWIKGEKLSAYGIGTVSTHPYYRGMGLMKSLINAALEDMKKAGAAFCVLGGQRQRYEHYGFEPVGVKLHCVITADNLRFTFPGRSAGDISFVRIGPDDSETIGHSYALQQRTPFHIVRRQEDFLDICRSWHSTPFAILKGQRYIGYLACSEDRGNILELETVSAADIQAVLPAYASCFSVKTISLNLAPYEKSKIKILSAFCESLTVDSAYNLRVFRYADLIRWLLSLKADFTRLSDGHLSVEIEGEENLLISVHDQQVSVEETDRPADIRLKPLSALTFFFSPVGPFFRSVPQADPCAASWFPLPFFWPGADQL